MDAFYSGNGYLLCRKTGKNGRFLLTFAEKCFTLICEKNNKETPGAGLDFT
jgi:hypothetical protein